MKTYHFDTEITDGSLSGKTVREAFNENKKSIFKLIKKYRYHFDDDVLAAAGIKKIVRDVAFTNVIVDGVQPKQNNKKLKKERKSLDEILDEIYDEQMNVKDVYEYDAIDDDINNIEMPIDPEI